VVARNDSTGERDREVSAIVAPQDIELDVVVVGAGFAGLYMLHRLRSLGLRVRAFDAAGGVGGTWFWNRYPGARCDIESMEYSYSFSEELQQEWDWSERYPAQPEILRYLNHVADRFDLRRDIALNTSVLSATLDVGCQSWTVRASTGLVRCRFVVMATGCLSSPRLPDVDGLDRFGGDWYHTASWPHEGVDFTGRRVGVIGTGSSGIQAIPQIARQAEHLWVFQRTPHFSLPARNAPLDPEQQTTVKHGYEELRRRQRASFGGLAQDVGHLCALEVDAAQRTELFTERWQIGGAAFMTTFNDITRDVDANRTAAEFVRAKIRDTVRDPEVARARSPTDYPIGAKRICLDTEYYETFNRSNVSLVDLREASIETIIPEGIRTTERVYDLDCIVFATGFDAMTGALRAIDIRGRDGVPLTDRWQVGPRAYLGLAVHGFPNLFLVTGPGSPSVLSNMVVSIEQHVEWIADCIEHLDARELGSIEPELAVEDAWVEHVSAVAASTLYTHANSWYLGANVVGKPRVFMPYVGGVHRYAQRCREVASAGYEGFITQAARQPTSQRPAVSLTRSGPGSQE
jgi:cyclohexanone monooxygenase